MTAAVVVQRSTPDDWPAYRDIRLAALAADPSLFGSDLAREQAFTEAEWRQRTVGSSVARAGGVPVGVVGWFWSDEPLPADAPRRADLVAMWVAPDGRGHGVGALLVRDVVDQVVVGHGAVLELSVLVDNEAATNLYQRCGFVETGRVAGHREGDVLRRMRYAPTGAGQRGTP